MHRFAARNLARGFLPKASADSKREDAHQGDGTQPYRGTLLTFRGAEMAEQVVSDVIVQECVLRCGTPWRGCGIPADDHCLLALHGAARTARAMRREGHRDSSDASVVLNLATPARPGPAGNATPPAVSFPVPADPPAPGRQPHSVCLADGTTSPVSSR
jgi:hypothetical protein